jgi:hypothetical protein
VIFWVLRGVEIEKLNVGAVATGCLLGCVYLSDLHLEAGSSSLLNTVQFQRAVVAIRYTARHLKVGRSFEVVTASVVVFAGVAL